mmetsp:Transcript_39193/g.155457  ORF Transcript_39193/g.155457 Transcript_39193/m.155457 type:complete len:677 (-) Transcript_39193:1409-3439(-)
MTREIPRRPLRASCRAQNPIATGKSDYIDAIVVSVDHLLTVSKGRKGIKPRIALFTNARGVMTEEEQLEKVVGGMHSNGIRFDLFLAGPDYTDCVRNDGIPMDKSMTEKLYEIILERTDDETYAFSLAHLTSIAKSCQGSVMFLSNPSTSFEPVGPKVSKSGVKFKGTFDVTTKINIPVRIFGRIMPERPPTALKLSLKESQTTQKAVRANVETVYINEESVNVQDEQLIKGYAYGPNFLPVNTIDAVSLQFSAPKRFCLLSVVPKQSFNRRLLLGPVDSMLPFQEDAAALKAFAAVWKATLDSNELLITRFVKKEGSSPILNAVWPHPETVMFCVSPIPTAEDVRDNYFLNFKAATESLSDDQRRAAAAFIDRKTMKDWKDASAWDVSDEGSSSDLRIPLPPWNVANPLLRHFQDCITSRAIQGAHSDMPEPSPFVKSMKDLTDNPGDSDEVLQVFGEVKRRLRRQPDSDRKRFAKGKNYYVVPELDNFLPDSKVGVPKEVGEMHPLEDFNAMLSCKTEDLFEEAIASMFSVFQRLIGASVNGDRFERATSCIAAVRRACRANDEEQRFNDLLDEFVASAEGGNKNAKSYLALVETKTSVASALQMLIVLEGDTEQTAPEEVEGMRQRMIAAASLEDSAASKNPFRSNPTAHTEEPKKQGSEDDDDLGGMIEDIV